MAGIEQFGIYLDWFKVVVANVEWPKLLDIHNC